MKQIERTAARPTRGLWPLVVTGSVVAIGWGVYRGMDHAPASDAPPPATPTPISAQTTPLTDTAAATTAPAPATRADLPATPPPGLVLVSTAPDAQPPQATLLVDGRLQAQPLGSNIAGAGLQVREVSAGGITLGQPDGPPLYTLPVALAAQTARLMAEARAQRLAERQPTLVRPVGEPVVLRDPGPSAARPDEMKVTVPRRQPVTSGPVGSL